ncbi:MAG: hypothetical protein P0116_04430 [Candidatus Nitrosocosmicus sp.]|nr:hypothetical protein [Candidatus Nitrosocosmicus sp.]
MELLSISSKFKSLIVGFGDTTIKYVKNESTILVHSSNFKKQIKAKRNIKTGIVFLAFFIGSNSVQGLFLAIPFPISDYIRLGEIVSFGILMVGNSQ